MGTSVGSGVDASIGRKRMKKDKAERDLILALYFIYVRVKKNQMIVAIKVIARLWRRHIRPKTPDPSFSIL